MPTNHGYWIPKGTWGSGDYFYYGPFPTKEAAIDAAGADAPWLVFCDEKWVSFTKSTDDPSSKCYREVW